MPPQIKPSANIAYDYSAQKWVDGEEARTVRRTQLLDEIALLKSPRGSEYLRFLGSAHTVDEALQKASEELSALDVAL